MRKTAPQQTTVPDQQDKNDTGLESGSDAPPAAETAENQAAPFRPPAVHDIVAAANEEIEIAEVHVLPSTEAPAVFEVSIRGAAGGLEPKEVVERFRQVVEAGLGGNENRSLASARIEQFEEGPDARPDQKPTRFLIIATVSSIQSPVAPEKPAL
jgi:hypothetical protein